MVCRPPVAVHRLTCLDPKRTLGAVKPRRGHRPERTGFQLPGYTARWGNIKERIQALAGMRSLLLSPDGEARAKRARESFRPPFPKGGAHPRRVALVVARRRRNNLGVFFLPSFFFCACCVKRKSGGTSLAIQPAMIE